MLHSLINKKEAEIYDCLSNEESPMAIDFDNIGLGPWNKYKSSVHQRLQRIQSISAQKTISEYHSEQIASSNRSKQISKTHRKLSQEKIENIPYATQKTNRTSQYKTGLQSKSKNNSLVIQQLDETTQTTAQIIQTDKKDQNNNQQDKQNIGFFVECYPSRKYTRSGGNNFQTSKQYFEKMALKMMYGVSRGNESESNQVNTFNSQINNVNLKKSFYMNQKNQHSTNNSQKPYLFQKELKFKGIHCTNTKNSLLNQLITNQTQTNQTHSQNLSKQISQQQSKSTTRKLVNRKTLVSFHSSYQLLEYQLKAQFQKSRILSH